MNATQHATARAIIESAVFLCDGSLTSILPCDAWRNPSRGFVCCGIGELALAAGHTFEELRDFDEPLVPYTEGLPRLVTAFGLSENACIHIVAANEDPIEQLGGEFGAGGAFITDYGDDGSEYDLPAARKAAVLSVLDASLTTDAAHGRTDTTT